MKTSLVRIKTSFLRLSNISPQLVLAVATYVSAEADAQIPLALMPGFRFPLVYNSPPLVYHNPTVHFYKVEEEEQTEDSNEKMEERSRILNSYCDESKTFCPWIAQPECRNNEGSLVPCIQLDYNL